MSIFLLNDSQDWERLLELSESRPILVFKHSTQCPISAAAFEELRRFAQTADSIDCGVVQVVERPVLSNTIAARLEVQHESPQAILIENGRPTWHASHWSITREAIERALKSN